MDGKRVSESRVTLTQVMNVTDANVLGNVHGGLLMKVSDEAGGIAAARHACRPVVTVTVDSMTFYSPVQIGNLVTFSAEVTWAGRTSMETRVVVAAENKRYCHERRDEHEHRRCRPIRRPLPQRPEREHQADRDRQDAPGVLRVGKDVRVLGRSERSPTESVWIEDPTFRFDLRTRRIRDCSIHVLSGLQPAT